MRRSRWQYILPALLIIAGHSWATELQFAGQKPVGHTKLRRMVVQWSTQPGLQDSLSRWLADAGYQSAVVTMSDNAVEVKAGPRSILKQLEIQGDTALSFPIDRPFTADDFEQTMNRLHRDLEESGYFFSTVRVKSLHRDGANVTPTVVLRRGPVALLGRLRMSGLKRTDPDLIMRHLTVQPGDTVTTRLLDRVERDLHQLDFIRLDSALALLPRPGYTAVDIEARLRERKTFDFEGIAGYGPDSDERLLWSLRLELINMFGGGRGIALHSSRSGPSRQELEVHYRQPLFLLGVGRFEVSVATRDFQGQFYDFNASGSCRFYLSSRLELGTQLGWKTVTSEDNRPDYTGWSAGLDLDRDTRNDRYTPSSGYRLSWDATYTNRRYRSDTAGPVSGSIINDTKVRARGEWVMAWTGRLVTSLSSSYHGLHTEEDLPPPAELFLIGGPGSLRGYRNERFPAIHAGLLALESRWRIAGGYAMVFYDGAYLNNRVATAQGAVTTEEDYRHGYGLGMRLVRGDGAITITLGWQPELTLDQPRLSVQLRSEF
ncbi:MAG: BamA/TamA family outer membrane protein [bacterium]